MTEPRDEIEDSVAQGIITPAQAEAIRARRPEGAAAVAPAPEGGDEPFKLVSNFGDVFLCLGLVILYWSVGAFAAVAGLPPLAVYGGFAALFWLLAEFFVFRARKKFPAVVSILFFAWMAYNAVTLFLGETSLAEAAFGLADATPHLAALCAAFAVALIRFRQPILVLALGVTGTLLAFGLARQYLSEAPALLVLGSCGVLLLILGIWLDRQDPARTGIKHEWALWLFVVGSPLTVHSILMQVILDGLPDAGVYTSGTFADAFRSMMEIDLTPLVLTVALIALCFILLGLLLDRRSLVASTLLYLSAVLTYMAAKGGVGLAVTFAIVPLTIGLLVIFLGAAWNPIRRTLLHILPFAGLFRPPDQG